MDLGQGAADFESADCTPLTAPAAAMPLTSAEFLTAALKQAGVGTWQVDMLTGLSTWDAVASGMRGLAPMATSVTDMMSIHADDRAMLQERFEQHARMGGTDDIEFRIVRPDGETRWLHATGRRTEEADGVSRYIAGIVVDVTERRIAAELLREAEERYRLISQVTTDVIFDWDIQNDRIRWNEAKGAFFGYNSSDLASMNPLREKIHPDDQERVLQEFAQLFKSSASSYASDHRMQDSTDNYRDIHACGSIIRDASGTPVRMVGSMQDVSERRYADAALRESEAINRGIVQASTDSVVLLDLEGKLLFLNKSGGVTAGTKDLGARYGEDWATFWPEHARYRIVEAVKTAASGGTGHVVASFMHDGQSCWWDVVVSPIRDDAGNPIKLVAIARDITQQKESEEELRRAATYDSLTELPNRAFFQERLSQAVKSVRNKGGRLGLLLLDVDDFKQVNDGLGHDAGDAVLKCIATRLDIPAARSQTVARLGGDEFAVLIDDVANEEELSAHARVILDRMKEPLVHAGRMLDCKVTIGAAIFPEHGSSTDELLKSADIALYVAKDAGRGAYATFEHKHRAGLQARADMLSTARSALGDGRIEPFYQPKRVLHDQTIYGFEALLRWRHPTLGMQLPSTISAAFEDLELATAISRTMIDLVIADLRAWLDSGLAFGHVAVNAGAAEFRSDNFAETVLERLHAARIPTNCFQVEVTETVFLGQGAESVGRALKLLDDEGVRIALDDFGTGYASLRHLKQFPVHVLKIDQGFVQGMRSNDGDEAIISAVINLGKNLGIEVVAEGIETLEQEARLRDLGCEYGQGFLYSKGVPAAMVPSLVRGERSPSD